MEEMISARENLQDKSLRRDDADRSSSDVRVRVLRGFESMDFNLLLSVKKEEYL